MKKNGFTLVELLMYMGLLGIFLVVLTDILVQTLDTRTQATAQTFVASDGEYLRSRLEYDVRRSSAIVAPVSTGTPSATLQLTIGGSTQTFALQGTNLVVTTGGNSYTLNTSSTAVSGFQATRVGNGTGKDTLTLAFTISSIATSHSGAAETKAYTFTIGTR